MGAKVLLSQVNQLRKVSARLESVAGKLPLLTAPLMMIAETIRACAAFLEVLVATRLRARKA